MNVKDVKWVTLLGDVTVKGQLIKYTPVKSKDPDPAKQLAARAALIKSNIDFVDGEIELRVRLANASTRVQVVLGHDTARQVFVGLNGGTDYGFGISVWETTPSASGTGAGGWKTGSFGGVYGALPTDRDILMRVKVLGSTTLLFIDGVQVAKLNVEIPRSQVGVHFWGEGSATAELVFVKTSKPTAFVVMQFTDEFNALYRDVIKITCEKFGYEVIRGDDIYTSGLIIEDISRSIRDASLIVADITPKNPNVFYEVGFAHAIAKPTILMAKKSGPNCPSMSQVFGRFSMTTQSGERRRSRSDLRTT